ncbi:hypothetical protein [Zoogloea sp.]|uniref:hypothetical protein n=1 Tax=Zoogloea sp. TaxID=49181 RepID=UPI002606AA16|nr:hypothetical protein [Zoogloea sp.]MDD3352830.1 hypothetical protein [Zoogloea sp.]
MDKYEQFEIEQRALLNALAESGPSEGLLQRMQALYQDACLSIALGPSLALSHQDGDRESADEQDVAFYTKAIASGALAKIFEAREWGDVTLDYEALLVDEAFCPGVRVSWSNKVAFLAGGKDGTFNLPLERMAGALARMLSARWYRWQVRVV